MKTEQKRETKKTSSTLSFCPEHLFVEEKTTSRPRNGKEKELDEKGSLRYLIM